MDRGIPEDIARIRNLVDSNRSLGKHEGKDKTSYFRGQDIILPMPRAVGDSRYVYGDNGFNFWAHASGYMYANEGLFSIFPRKKQGDEPVIAFFLGTPAEADSSHFLPISLLPVPVLDSDEKEINRRHTIINREACYFIVENHFIRSTVRAIVNEDNNIGFTIVIENLKNSDLKFYTSSYFRPFCRHQMFETDEDPWFAHISWTNNHDSNGIFSKAKIEVGEDLDRFQSKSNFALIEGRYCPKTGLDLKNRYTNTSRLNYIGDSRRNLSSATALCNGKFLQEKPITTFSDIAVASDICHFQLKGNSFLRLDYNFKLINNETDFISQPTITLTDIDHWIARNHKKQKTSFSSLQVKTTSFDPSLSLDDNDFNAFFEHLKYQVSVCGLLKGYMQVHPRSLVGIRDVFQALEGLLYYRPEASRDKMIEALGFTTPNGRCLRQYSLPSKGGEAGAADIRKFIDQGVWVVTAIHTYLQYTGDMDFLEEEVGYHEILDEDSHSIAPVEEKDSVLQHLLQIMKYLDSKRDHEGTKLLRILYGDWNDALDGLGIAKDQKKDFGTGVSIMATLQYYQNCLEMIQILERFYPNAYEKEIERFHIIRKEIRGNLIHHAIDVDENNTKRIVHGWGDEKSYFVGSKCDPDGSARDGLTSNAFWIISGMLEETPELEKDIIDAMHRLDSKYGLKTFHPAFPKHTTGVGRIPKLPPGTAENGATYVHATLFGIWALFLTGRPKEAWNQIEKILPFTSLHKNYTHSPFVMPNSYAYNPDLGLDGESMNDWQTGSSNVLLKVLIWFVFGYKPDFNGLRIQIASWTPFDGFEFETKLRGKSVKITYKKSKAISNDRECLVNGKGPIEGTRSKHMKSICYFIPYEEIEDHSEIQVNDQI